MGSINKVEEIISGFADLPHFEKFAQGMRCYNEHPDTLGDDHLPTLTRQIGVPVLISMLSRGQYLDLPIDMFVDELIDFTNIYIAQNSEEGPEGNMTLVMRPTEFQREAFDRDPMAFVLANFAMEFDQYLTKILAIK